MTSISRGAKSTTTTTGESSSHEPSPSPASVDGSASMSSYNYNNMASPSSSSSRNGGIEIPNRIFVGGITNETTDAELVTLFSRFGSVKGTKIVNDRAGVPRGYGFVTFETEEEAKRALADNDNLMLKDRKLNVAIAVKKHLNGRVFDPNYLMAAQMAASPFMYQLPLSYYAADPNAAAIYGVPTTDGQIHAMYANRGGNTLASPPYASANPGAGYSIMPWSMYYAHQAAQQQSFVPPLVQRFPVPQPNQPQPQWAPNAMPDQTSPYRMTSPQQLNSMPQVGQFYNYHRSPLSQSHGGQNLYQIPQTFIDNQGEQSQEIATSMEGIQSQQRSHYTANVLPIYAYPVQQQTLNQIPGPVPQVTNAPATPGVQSVSFPASAINVARRENGTGRNDQQGARNDGSWQHGSSTYYPRRQWTNSNANGNGNANGNLNQNYSTPQQNSSMAPNYKPFNDRVNRRSTYNDNVSSAMNPKGPRYRGPRNEGPAGGDGYGNGSYGGYRPRPPQAYGSGYYRPPLNTPMKQQPRYAGIAQKTVNGVTIYAVSGSEGDAYSRAQHPLTPPTTPGGSNNDASIDGATNKMRDMAI